MLARPRPPRRPPRRSYENARRAARRAGHVRLAILLALLGLFVGTYATLSGGAKPTTAKQPGHHPRVPHDRPAPATGVPAVEAGLLPWTLNAPLSRSVVLPASDGRSLIVAGGLQAGGAGSAQGVYEVSTATGAATQVGSLTAPLHDAAGAVLAGKGYLFGGGTAIPLASNQRLADLGTSQSTSAPAVALPSLPQARADDSAVTIGSTAYVIGGYDGPAPDAAVLATTDGSHFSVVADLPVPVRYAAVAALGGRIYVFGGSAASGPHAGDPVASVQVVDPATHSAALAGSLPLPVAGASAALLGGVLYVAGGVTGTGSSASATGTIWAWMPGGERGLVAGHLLTPVAYAGATVVGSRAWIVGGENGSGTATSAVQMFEPNGGFGTAGAAGAGSPYFGDKLLVADRGNDRLLLLDDTGKIIWRYPSAKEPPPPGGFYFPDDAFFTHHGTQIISNQENNDTVIQLTYPGGKVVWSYGHPRQPGSLPGYLNSPDDAYLLRNGDISVADPMNCRVLVLSQSKRILTQMGTPGTCAHNPPAYLGSPNGDTPLADGNLLVSEINGSWIDEYTTSGHLVWAVQLPIGYPSDPQQLSSDRYLVANYENPGGFIEFDRAGHILYQYGPSSGTGELNHPSLVEMLPSGVLMANDDSNDRMMAVDPVTGALVWQYGHTGVTGTAPGLLNTPDGFDLLGPNGTFPTHPATG